MGESEEVVQWGFNGRERGGFRLVLGEGIASVLELCSSVLIRLCSLDALWIFVGLFGLWFATEGTREPRTPET